MYPFVRVLKELWINRHAAPLGVREMHVSHHICWPWDLDMWMELNNGRTLTLYDLGRMGMGQRSGLLRVLKTQGWALAMAGGSVRYRRRVKMFDRVELRSRLLGWDGRFFYMEHAMWRGDECTSHALIRAAATSKDGMIPPARVAHKLGYDATSPALPGWVNEWIRADATRPWPPQGGPERSVSLPTGLA